MTIGTEETQTPAAAGNRDPWGEGASDWADVMEGWNGWGVPAYRHVADHVGLGAGMRVLDVGCGAGRFCRLAADRGAEVAALDGSPPFVEIARARVLDADIRIGEMASLPWPDDSFDLVTGFNSFFLAGDIAAVLSEARRVARSGGTVATTAFGRPDRCDSTNVFAVLDTLAGAEPEDESKPAESGPPAFHEEGVFERHFDEAGLTIEDAGYLELEEVYADAATATRGFLAAPPFRRASAAFGEEAVREAVLAAVSGFVGDDGRCRLREEARYAIGLKRD